MNGTACTSCQSYNKGKGTKACLRCEEFKDLLPAKANPDIIRLPRELLENLNNPSNDLANIFELIAHLEPIHATMFLQSTLLNMSCREIAEYHQAIYSKNSCARKINQAIELISIMGQLKNK